MVADEKKQEALARRRLERASLLIYCGLIRVGKPVRPLRPAKDPCE